MDWLSALTVRWALVTVNDPVALEANNVVPANRALTSPAYEPAFRPRRLTPARVATPSVPVKADPAGTPLNVKSTLSSDTSLPGEDKVAVSVVEPP